MEAIADSPFLPPSEVPSDGFVAVTAAESASATFAAPPPEILVAAAAAAASTPTPVATAAAVTFAQAILPVISSVLSSQANRQPLVDILSSCPVTLDDADIPGALEGLDLLMDALKACLYPQTGRCPGFATATDLAHDLAVGRQWNSAPGLPSYETFDFFESENFSVPIPTVAFALRCFEFIKQIWQTRLVAVADNGNNFCSCISVWEHFDGCILQNLSNQTLEQLMISEASTFISSIIDPEAWHRTYSPEFCPSPDDLRHLTTPDTYIKLLRNRDQYMATVCKFALAAQHSIQISTCYVFPFDAAHRYLLVDLLPHLIRTRRIKVQVMIDLMTVESAILRSGFLMSPNQRRPKGRKNPLAITPTSFADTLPEGAPPISEDPSVLKESTLTFLTKLQHIAASLQPYYQIRFWCARDATYKYRIKNHSKCTIFDQGRVAVIGGSNLCPTMNSSTSDLDALIAGPCAKDIQQTFVSMWDAMGRSSNSQPTDNEVMPTRDADSLQAAIASEDWTDRCSTAIVRSEPSSAGEDSILRVVLGAMNSAEKTILVSMGHSNFPKCFAQAVADACQRGVTVQIVVNSLYSNDLRGGQRDLFLSIRDLLRMAPTAKVYTTATAELRGNPDTSWRPLFLHGKYVVVDTKWVALGSWNVWTRSAFHEVEHEAWMESEVIAQSLTSKFEQERDACCLQVDTTTCCQVYCPSGCFLCRGFGQFFQE